MTDAEPIADLSQVRWTAREVFHDYQQWHVAGEVGNDPDPHVREVYDLEVAYADDGDGGDCSAWLAEQVARKLSESDTTARWQRDRAVQAVNEAGHAIMRALDFLNNVQGQYPSDEELVEDAVALLRPHAREAP